jgi:2-polyprenyl-3-methyl-5-hydroxy-6-metoxy-1,4-benzoquinol methylase
MAPERDRYNHMRREEVLPFVPPDAKTVLDFGCAGGYFGRALMEERSGIVVDGVEINASAAAEAAEAYRAVVVGQFPEVAPPGQYDVIVCNDVLEHLVDPWSTVDALRAHLAPDGILLASIPNMRYWGALGPLLRGRWDYRDDGVLDRTHLRWFTKATMRELFESTGYTVDDVHRITGRPMNRKWKLASFVARRFVDDVLTMQYLVVAHP